MNDTKQTLYATFILRVSLGVMALAVQAMLGDGAFSLKLPASRERAATAAAS